MDRDLEPETKPCIEVLPSDVLKVIVGEEEQLKCNPILKLEPPHSLDQEDPPEPPHIKEEQEELWSSQEGEQLLDIPKEPARNSHPDPHLQPESDDSVDSDFWTPLDHPSVLISQSNDESKLHQRKSKPMELLWKNLEKSYSCSECGNIFTNFWTLKIHMNIHTGKKPFSCSVCSKTFTQKSTLKDHMVLHTGEKPFSCSVCDQRFTWYNTFRSHEAACTKSSQLHQNQTEENREAEPGASSSTEQLNLQIKEEPEELWSSQEGEQLQHITKFPFTPVPVKSEDDEEKPQSSQLHQTQTEHMEPAADGEDCGGPEPARNSHPDPHLQPKTEDQPEDSSETEDSDDYSKETREPQSGLKALKNKVSERDKRRKTGQKQFICSFCGKRFSRNDHLESHMRTHTGAKPFSCSVCSKTFALKGNLTAHLVLHTGEKRFSCKVCEKRFMWNSSLRNHKAVCLQSSQLHQNQTEENREAESGASSSTEHMEPAADGEDCGGPEPARNSHPDPHLQPETEDQPEDSSETEDSVDYSKETREPQSGLKALKNKVSESDKGGKTGQKQFICSLCGKIFRCNDHLQRHLRIHTGEKPFSCSVCSKTFQRKANLTRHMVVHTGETPFSCSVCSKTFSLKGHLTRHIVLHTRKKPFSCSVCCKTFTQKGHLTNHMILHTGENPFRCSVCLKTFTKKSTLKDHMVVHTGEKRFSCKDCEQRFMWTSALRRHKAVCTKSSQLHQNQTEENREAEPGASSSTEHMEPAADGEDCGGPEPARNSHPDPHLQPETEDQPEDSSETDDRHLQPDPKKRFSCSECGERFLQKSTLKRHMKIHMGKKP